MRYLSINQLSEITGRDRRTIKKRLSDVPVHETTATSYIYDTQMALPAIFGATDSESLERRLNEEKIKFEAARAEKTQLDVEKLKGTLISVDLVATTVEREYAYVKAQLMSIPTKLAKPLSMIDDPLKVKEALDEAIAEVLNELSSSDIYAEQPARIEAAVDTSPSVDGSDEAQPSGMGGHL